MATFAARNELLSTTNRSFSELQRQLFALRRRSLRACLCDSLTLPNLIILIWCIVLIRGEIWSFKDSTAACDWKNWERWPEASKPHHLILLADPQLIDAHTYPGRPWPFSTFTVWHTDLYLHRSYQHLQQNLHPDTLYFLGDLFDGGREWGSRQSSNEDSEQLQHKRPSQEKGFVKAWKRYGDTYWLNEYNRFGKIFYKNRGLGGGQPGPGQRGRRIITTLPGNHDLGFGVDIQLPTRNRFHAYFGEGNRVDVIGNHTFVSVDSVSLSAGSNDKQISGPAEAFLAGIETHKRKAVARELRYLNGQGTELVWKHVVEYLETANFAERPSLLDGPLGNVDLPTVVMTHVPLYRKVGEPCGPLRERFPPTLHSKNSPPVNPDERNAIPVQAGFQYQCVLSQQDSERLISTIGNVKAVFSGDDHDYCEVVHQDMENVREITVKSMSYAMGVRKPGFLMVSMWNPIDPSSPSQPKNMASAHGAVEATIQTHLCLLPDQIGILVRYGWYVFISIAILVVNASINQCWTSGQNHRCNGSKDSFPCVKDLEVGYQYDDQKLCRLLTSSSKPAGEQNGLSNRPGRSKSLGPGALLPTAMPLNGASHYNNDKPMSGGRKKNAARALLREMWEDGYRVTRVVVLIFLFLARFG